MELFSSWKNLNAVSITSNLTAPAVQLLENLLKQEQLVRLTLNSDAFDPVAVDFILQFLEQTQFMLTSGSSIFWWVNITLHDDSFKALGILEWNLQFKKQSSLVSYFNSEATEGMTDEEFQLMLTTR
ncbi:hypothetical protein L596_017676 [Steinernema carpocapsae]|uniref:Uncharacterized protein n=1 Tax=Steinernema carpocapsae TaxID=34508 RepID=A0A4U5N2C6_STECR|nr:hypothetical protein L596_017676 [Steinernema carpocapsae]